MKRPRKLWFRAKEYGWGWYPISWQGWAVTLVFILLYTLSGIGFAAWLGPVHTETPWSRNMILGVIEFVLWMAFLTALLIRICYRTGEAPSWRWGKKEASPK